MPEPLLAACIFFLAIVTDTLAVTYLNYLTKGVIKYAIPLSIILTLIGYTHIIIVVEKNILFLICDGVGSNIGVFIGMKIKKELDKR